MLENSISRKDLLEYLNHIEEKYSVESWKIQDVHIWPIVKIDIFFRLVNYERSLSGIVNLNKNKKANKISSIFRISKSLFYYIQLLFLRRKEKIPYIFSDSIGHRVLFEERLINRYFYPILDQLHQRNHDNGSITINDDLSAFDRYPTDESIFFIQKFIPGSKLIRFLKNKSYKVEGNNYNDFIKEIQKKYSFLGIDNNYQGIIRTKVFEILSISDIVSIILQKYSPKIIFELCYYSKLRMAINFSAHKFNIPTIEIQHGGVGVDHVAYNGWKRIPESGFNVFPKTFWTWDDNTRSLIHKWLKGNKYHNVIFGGNPWLKFSLKNVNNYYFNHHKKIILITLQDELLDDYIYKTIEISPNCYEWWIRGHPRFSEIKIKIQEEFKMRKLFHRINVNEADEYPLPVILSKSVIHLSGSSGSILEASILKTPSIILNPIGERYYKEFIISGDAFTLHTKSAANLMRLIEEKQRDFPNNKVNSLDYSSFNEADSLKKFL